MKIHPTAPSFDLPEFNLGCNDALDVRRSAELARAEYLGKIAKKIGRRIVSLHRSAGELFSFTRRQNGAVRL